MSQPLTIAMGQINVLVGDVAGNTAKIIATIRQARQQQADIVVFPELCITGYPPEDLLFRPQLQQQVDNALAQLAGETDGIAIVVGHPLTTPNSRFNAASVLANGKILTQYAKQHLPNYSVFDELRYFTPGTQTVTFTWGSYTIALTICEDLWHAGPLQGAAQAGADLVLCLNASPFHLDKAEQRLAILQQRQQLEGQIPIVYVNTIGGQDELIFDGGSMLLAATGELCHRAPFFTEHLSICQFHDGRFTARDVSPNLDQESQIYQALCRGTRDYCHKNNFQGALIGLSGGIDSALTLAIAADALGPENVHAVLMPSRYTAAISNEDAIAQANALGVSYSVISIEPSYQAFLTTLHDEFAGLPEDITEENLQARCRGVILMALSNKTGKLVLTTGNKSEMAVGYATLYGDMAGGFALLKDVLKTMVYRLAQYRNQQQRVIPERVITRAPSAELRFEQRDQDTLPDYPTLDRIIDLYVNHNYSVADIIATGLEQKVVQRVIAMINRNEYKRRQAAPGIRISERAFGRDWRMPITSGFKS